MFEPINKAHAIVEMVIFFGFPAGPETEDVVNEIITIKDSLKDDFPNSNLNQGYRLNVGEEKVDRIPGAELTHHRKGDGHPDWLIRISANSFSVHCLDYTRWDDVWKKSYKYISTAFKTIESIDLPLTEIGLKYVDRFKYLGNSNDYKIEELLRTDSGLIFDRAFSSGRRWHSHVGWFDTHGFNGEEILNQLKLDSTIFQQPEPDATFVLIDHTTSLRAQDRDMLNKYKQTVPTQGGVLDSLIQFMHNNNKTVMQKILQKDIAGRIKLASGGGNNDE